MSEKPRVCLDTNIFIAVKNREEGYESCEKILDAIDDGIIEAVVSTIVVAEVLVGFYRNNEIAEAEKFVNHVTQRFMVKGVDVEVANMGAKLRAGGLKLPDAIVVSTAILSNSILITKDKRIKHRGIEILTPEEFVERCLGE